MTIGLHSQVAPHQTTEYHRDDYLGLENVKQLEPIPQSSTLHVKTIYLAEVAERPEEEAVHARSPSRKTSSLPQKHSVKLEVDAAPE
jgi:hypothetical protein